MLGRINVFLESQSSANKTIDEMKEMISELRKEQEDKDRKIAEKDKVLADLRENLERLSAEHYGPRSQKGGTTRKADRQKSTA